MKTIKRMIATSLLVMTISAIPVFACGDMTAGSKCLVQTTPTTETKPAVDTKGAYDFDKEFASFLRGFFGKIFG